MFIITLDNIADVIGQNIAVELALGAGVDYHRGPRGHGETMMEPVKVIALWFSCIEPVA